MLTVVVWVLYDFLMQMTLNVLYCYSCSDSSHDNVAGLLLLWVEKGLGTSTQFLIYGGC